MLLIGDLRFPPESIKHLQAQRRTLARESAIPPVFNGKPTFKPRASNEGTQFVRNLWRCLDAKVEVVTREKLREWLKPHLYCMCLHFQRFGVTSARVGMAGTLHYRQALAVEEQTCG